MNQFVIEFLSRIVNQLIVKSKAVKNEILSHIAMESYKHTTLNFMEQILVFTQEFEQ